MRKFEKSGLLIVKLIFCLSFVTLPWVNASQSVQKNINVPEHIQIAASVEVIMSHYVDIVRVCSLKNNVNLERNTIDFILRQKFGISFDKVIESFSDIDNMKKRYNLNDAFIIDKTQKCRKSLTKKRLQDLKQVIQHAIERLNKLDFEPFFPNQVPDNRKLLSIFRQKIKNIEGLPNEELLSLVSALKSGVYYYSATAIVKGVPQDHLKAKDILEYLANIRKQPYAFYALADYSQWINKEKAVHLMKTSAKLGYDNAKIWLVSYYSCIKDPTQYQHWLKRVDKNKFPWLEDLLMEIKEYGVPSDCIDGWVEIQ